MPELPDLEVFRKNLFKYIIKKTIAETGTNAPKSIISGSLKDLEKISWGEKFTKIDRRGKHLIFTLSNKSKLILHLMLRGRLEYNTSISKKQLSDCFWFVFKDKSELKVTDNTHWVKLEILKDGNLAKSKLLSKLGPEADEITLEEFKELLKRSRIGRIKPLLMDQKKIAGIGNAYADEILWKSKIHPNKTASMLTDKQIKTLHSNIKKILKWGTSQNAKELGSKLEESKRKWMKVYRKEGKPCPRCKTKISFAKVNQRDTFYCKKCQGRN